MKEDQLAATFTGYVIGTMVFVIAGVFIALFKRPKVMLPILLTVPIGYGVFGLGGLYVTGMVSFLAGLVIASSYR